MARVETNLLDRLTQPDPSGSKPPAQEEIEGSAASARFCPQSVVSGAGAAVEYTFALYLASYVLSSLSTERR